MFSGPDRAKESVFLVWVLCQFWQLVPGQDRNPVDVIM